MENKKITLKEQIACILILTITSALFVYFFSQSTSPILENYYSYDSAIFQVIGKSWGRGIVPYSECFDHKGPLIFFINGVGYALGMGKVGVAVVQWLFCIGTFSFLYRLIRLFLETKKSMLVVLLSYVIWTITYGGGNLTEEYSLFFIIGSLYFGFQYIRQFQEQEADTWKHPLRYAFVYGLSFVAILFMRVTNALAICCLVFLIFCILVWKKEIKNLLGNIVGFLLGATTMFLPFAIYFYVKDSLYNMLFGTILYNVMYASNSGLEIDKEILLCFFSSFMLFVIGIFHVIQYKEKKDFLGYFAIVLAILSAVLFLRINSYPHYQMITLPYFAISVGLASEFQQKKSKYGKVFFRVAMLIFCIQVAGGAYKMLGQKKVLATDGDFAKQYIEFCETFQQYIPEEEKKDVLTFGRNSLSAWYLINDTDPTFTYCFVQDWQAKNSTEMTEEILDYLNGEPAKWLVTNADYETKELYMPYNQEFKEIILERYEYVASYSVYETYNLYKRKK